MKKALILAYDFPPYVSVGGLRPYSWFKYLYRFGVRPIVVTRQWSNTHGNELDYVSAGDSDETVSEETENGLILKTPYLPNLSNRLLLKSGPERNVLIRKAVTAFYEVFQYVLWVGPKSGLFHEADSYLQKNEVDVIIATAEPYVLFRYASELSKRHGVPWIADYRDPWVQGRQASNVLSRWWYGYQERKALRNASSVVTVSKFCENKISQNVKDKSFSISSRTDLIPIFST